MLENLGGRPSVHRRRTRSGRRRRAAVQQRPRACVGRGVATHCETLLARLRAFLADRSWQRHQRREPARAVGQVAQPGHAGSGLRQRDQRSQLSAARSLADPGLEFPPSAGLPARPIGRNLSFLVRPAALASAHGRPAAGRIEEWKGPEGVVSFSGQGLGGRSPVPGARLTQPQKRAKTPVTQRGFVRKLVEPTTVGRHWRPFEQGRVVGRPDCRRGPVARAAAGPTRSGDGRRVGTKLDGRRPNGTSVPCSRSLKHACR